MTAILDRLGADTRVSEAQLARRVQRYPFFGRVESASGPEIVVDGARLINFGSNNYLGLATDARVIEAATAATARWGTGVTGSRLLNGTLELHESLEGELAEFFGKEAALVFPTGYAANLGLFTGALESGDFVAADREAHASIVDALQMTGCRNRRFAHNSWTGARRRLLSEATDRKAVVIEGVYSMRGDVAPVDRFVEIARETGALLVVDEAHGVGAVGPRGRGGAEARGVLSEAPVITITFSKSLASCGGAVLGPSALIEVLKVRCRPFLFTASNTPGSLAAAKSALGILREEPELVAQLATRARELRAALASAGLRIEDAEGPIITIPIGSDFETVQAWRLLRNRGVFANPVLTPAVAKGHGLLRLSVMRTHAVEHFERAVPAFAAIRRWTEPRAPDNGSLEPAMRIPMRE